MILLDTVNSRVGTKNHTRRHSLLILCMTLIKVFEAFARQQQNVSKRLSICLCRNFCLHKNGHSRSVNPHSFAQSISSVDSCAKVQQLFEQAKLYHLYTYKNTPVPIPDGMGTGVISFAYEPPATTEMPLALVAGFLFEKVFHIIVVNNLLLEDVCTGFR